VVTGKGQNQKKTKTAAANPTVKSRTQKKERAEDLGYNKKKAVCLLTLFFKKG
jgi:hypothetical protein